MCRWLAYDGPAIRASAVLFDSDHSLIRQSMAAREGVTPVNGDGFGVAWYPQDGTQVPRRYRSTQPAWNDVNLHDLTDEIRTTTLLAHVRASSGPPVQQTNCHPFRAGAWSFVHNGELLGVERYRRELLAQLDEASFDSIAGSTDSELLFALARTFGLDADPRAALARAIGAAETAARAHGFEGELVQATIAVSDGDRVHALRYATGDATPRTLYHTTHEYALQEMVPGHPDLLGHAAEVGLIVSEPLTALPGEWEAVPPDTWMELRAGTVTTSDFAPIVA